MALLSSAACSSDDEAPSGAATTTATAAIEAKSGNTTLTGTATFVKQEGHATKLTLQVAGAPPGDHGAHIHETGDCSAADGASAGGHWNPAMLDHGMPGATPSHLGDLGNLTVKADGTGTLTIEKADWTIDDEGVGDIMYKAIVIHEKVDDFGQPTGNAGGRIGCGEINEVETPN